MHRGKGMKFVGDSRIKASDRMPNIPKDYSEYPGKTEAFYPDFLLKEWLVGAVFLIGFLCLTIVAPPPLERIADATDTAYIPMPDWYFLFLYQFLKYSFASGKWTVLGAFIIPGIAFTALLLAPFLDRGPKRRPLERPLATGFMLLGVAAVFYLTWEAAAHHDWEAAKRQGEIRVEAEVDKSHEGYAIYEQSCLACHGENLEGSGANPGLVGTEKSVDEIKDIAVNGIGAMPSGIFQGTDEELEKLAEFIKSIEAK
ncbi:menaquinol-cytochrome c reductase cytochrome b/c subunit [Bacillus kwashiorkori]|uniref:menaquinol-cytochrome c reductase cytochrome b/c subunit n=1 Tax=Bacillus kwashiorkori TaxID=1522318 RepID=UPI00078492B4|nr:menaquinol-cytochrome c reductase cytochrome b/c subunit [Bacillus kwashiorkori]